jgi:hypothetical protein
MAFLRERFGLGGSAGASAPGHSDSYTKTDPGRSPNARICPAIRLHFITASSPPTVSRSRNMYMGGPVNERSCHIGT